MDKVININFINVCKSSIILGGRDVKQEVIGCGAGSCHRVTVRRSMSLSLERSMTVVWLRI